MRRGAIALLLGALLAVPAVAGAAAGRAGSIQHVFVIVLENKDYASSFGPGAQSTQLPALATQGVLLTQYYGTAHNSLPNYIAMVSGQGPNPVTQSDCQIYQDFLPGIIGSDGQALGLGCVYPATVKTVADQLDAAGLSWGGYAEDMATPCQHPALNSPDSTQSAHGRQPVRGAPQPVRLLPLDHRLADLRGARRAARPAAARPRSPTRCRT